MYESVRRVKRRVVRGDGKGKKRVEGEKRISEGETER